MLLFNATLPFLLIVLCYVYVVRRIRTLEVTQSSYKTHTEHTPLTPPTEITKKPTSTEPTQQKLRGFKKYKQITYFTLVLCVVYFVLWTPSVVYYTVLSVCTRTCFPSRWDGSKTEKLIVFVIKYLSYCNALVSPVLYCLRHPEIKTFIRSFFGRSEGVGGVEMETDTSKNVVSEL